MINDEMNADVMQTPEWWEAEQRYKQVQTYTVFSIMGITPILGPTLEELDMVLIEILNGCPEFFPAWFQRGEYLLRTGSPEGEECIEKAFNLLAGLIRDEEVFQSHLSPHIENLEKLLRYDLVMKYLEKAIHLFPGTATYYDYLAFCILQVPGVDKRDALRRQQEALEIDPDNDHFINNLGWIHLMMGNYQEAEENFQKALEYNPDNETAAANLDAVEDMEDYQFTFFEYLLRPADKDLLDSFRDNADFEGVTEECQVYNPDRREAFKIHHLQKKSLPPHEILNILQPLELFFNTLEKVVEGGFLYEELDLLQDRFQYLLYEFITNFDSIDEQILQNIGQSLTVFYEFLQETPLITPDRYNRFKGHITPLIKEFSGKIEEFQRLRFDPELLEAEREKSLEQLFGIT